MTRRHLPFGPTLRSALVCAMATWVTTWSWHAFTSASARYVVPLCLLALLTAFTGATCRWVRAPRTATLVSQLIVVGIAADLFCFGYPLPIGAGGRAAVRIFNDAVETANTYTPPVPATAPTIAPILIMAGAGCLVLMDQIAESFGRVAIAGLVLLGIYTVPVTLVSARPSWLLFVLAAGSYLWLLFIHESDSLDRWGRSLEGPGGVTDKDYRQSWVMSSTAGTVATFTLAVAVVVPWFVPTLDLSLGGFGIGGSGNKVSVINPITDLRRDLRRGDNVPLVVVKTDDPDPSYLRISVLNRFLSDQWSSGDRQIPTTQRADGALPPIPGLSPNLPRKTYTYSASATSDFSSTWLPTGELATSVDAQTGDWRYDLTSRDVIAANHDTNTENSSWFFTAIRPQYDISALMNAGSGANQVPPEDLDLPGNFPSTVRAEAIAVTEKGQTAFAKAVILQNWFRDNFKYSISRAPSGNGSDTLVGFLDPKTGRVGYCEQFASAMAAMARSLGIPARVAVGFLNGHPTGPDTWTYYTNDMHAWPELYFPGSGWVMFEPTPPVRASGVPAYTRLHLPPSQTPPDVSNTGRPTGRPSATHTVAPSTPTQNPATQHRAHSRTDVPWLLILVLLAVIVLLALVAATPRWVRRRRTARRLATTDPEVVWAELRDTCLDLGLAWPSSRSPRNTATAVADHFGRPAEESTEVRPPHGARVNPEAVAALDRLVDLIERGRYAATAPTVDPDTLSADGVACREALIGGVPRARRRRAEWLPASLVAGRQPLPPPAVSQTPAGSTEQLKVDA